MTNQNATQNMKFSFHWLENVVVANKTISHNIFKHLLSKTCPKFNTLTLSLLRMTQEAFVDSVDQDQTAQNVMSDL